MLLRLRLVNKALGIIVLELPTTYVVRGKLMFYSCLSFCPKSWGPANVRRGYSNAHLHTTHPRCRLEWGSVVDYVFKNLVKVGKAHTKAFDIFSCFGKKTYKIIVLLFLQKNVRLVQDSSNLSLLFNKNYDVCAFLFKPQFQ